MMELDRDRIRYDVAAILGRPVADIDDSAILTDHGLDSIRIMMLATKWASEGHPAAYSELAARPTIDQWCASLSVAGIGSA